MTLDWARIAGDFRRLVNLDADELAEWLETEESRRVGQMQPDGESIGHAAGRRTVGILRKPADAVTEDDYRHMRRTVGFIRRLGAQKPPTP